MTPRFVLYRSFVVLGIFWTECLGGVLVSATLMADESREAFFETDIRPLLIERCQECHGEGEEAQGGLSLASKEGWERGGERGPAVVPGDANASLLMRAIRGLDPELRMPPPDTGKGLTSKEIKAFEQWIDQGAFDPRRSDLEPHATQAKDKREWESVFAERMEWWSLKPVNVPVPPSVDDTQWQRPIDRFLRQGQMARGMRASPTAEPEVLIRRASLVLTGLPPTAAEVEAFKAAATIDLSHAYECLVDRLLQSPHFGERFARHWMDVVRFTETHGNEWNYDVPYAWRYRDYLIRAFNQDLPFDQLVREHLAGDLLKESRWNRDGQFNESLIGTAFFRFGEVNHDSCVLFNVIGYDIVDNQLDTTTKAFQAMTVACARCHDHKMDAVSKEDYHALLGVLRCSRSVMHTLDSPDVNSDSLAQLVQLKQSMRSPLVRAWREDVEGWNVARWLEASRDEALAKADPSDIRLLWNRSRSAISEGANEPTDLPGIWRSWKTELSQHSATRAEAWERDYEVVADFRDGMPAGWTTTGIGLRSGPSTRPDIALTHEGDTMISKVLPRGLFTFAESTKMNGALRSPELIRKHPKISFEVIGGQSSLARLVFNNCQLNYNHQHSIHHPEWTWITIDFPEHQEPLHPYAELLTYWDSPKFPDPLGTLGKDTENQRQPYDQHAKNPRTWWGLRRVIAHTTNQTPLPSLDHLQPFLEANEPSSLNDLLAICQQVTRHALDGMDAETATDAEVAWLQGLLDSGLLSNQLGRTTEMKELVERYRSIEHHQLILPRTMPGFADEGSRFDQPILQRGDPNRLGDLVARGYIRALDLSDDLRLRDAASDQGGDGGGSGRRHLAEVIASPSNPLTARVFVNRVWHWVMGQGIVRTPDDFGHMGEPPTHPELLDYLADQFIREGWSLKRLVRHCVLSQAFQLSSAPLVENRAQDPTNTQYSWYSARRAEAEVIRDSLLAVSGRLDPALYGPSIHPYRETADPEKRLFVGPLEGEGRRSLYIKFQLMEPTPFLSSFDLPGGKVVQGRRDRSNVPAQNLAMMNDPLVLALARRWGERVVQDTSPDTRTRIKHMMLAALGRAPSPTECQRLSELVETLARLYGVPSEEERTKHVGMWTDMAHAIFNLKEFIYIP